MKQFLTILKIGYFFFFLANGTNLYGFLEQFLWSELTLLEEALVFEETKMKKKKRKKRKELIVNEKEIVFV